MSGVEVNTRELDDLAGDLRKASKVAVAGARAVVGKGAVNVKNDWRAEWAGLSHAPALAAAVTYDVKIHVHDIEAEIGPDKSRRQGSLGNVIEFGTARNAPHPGGAPALAKEEPRFISAVEKLAGGILG